MTNFKLGAQLALAGMFLMGLIGCSGAGFPVALTSTSTTPSSTGIGSHLPSTSGTGTAQCGDGTVFTQCASLPVANATYAGTVPIAVMATSPYDVTGWIAYVNGVEVTSGVTNTPPSYAGTETQNWNGTISGLAPGNYNITISTWDNDKADGYTPLQYTVPVTVVASPLPTPPASATVYSNLQSTSSTPWEICNGTCSGSSGTTGSSVLETDATDAPTTTLSGVELTASGEQTSVSGEETSLSGDSIEQTSNGEYFNTLGYNHIGCPAAGCTSVSHFLDDVWFYIPSTTTALQALEFDPDMYTGTYLYEMSMACQAVSGNGENTNQWAFWNTAADEWTTNNSSGQAITTYPCTLLTQTNEWHHYQLYGTYDYSANTYTYETLVVDGTTVFQNLGNTYSATPYSASTPTMNIEEQVDNNSTATSNTVYYDDYNLTVW